MPKFKDTLTLSNAKHEINSYVGEYEGYTIFLNIDNICNNRIDVSVEEFYLVQDMERKYDYLYDGYLGTKGTILPFSKKTIGRIWLKSSLLEGKIQIGDYFISIIADQTNRKRYYSRFDYNGIEWKNTFSETEKLTKI